MSQASGLKNRIDFSDLVSDGSRGDSVHEQYGNQAMSQHGLLWRPKSKGPFPTVIFLHGGCWSSAYDYQHAFLLCQSLARSGHMVWLPEYRRIGELGGGWPGTFQDVTESIAWLLGAEAAQIDFDAVQLVGHSAGAHLALWLNRAQPGGMTLLAPQAIYWNRVVALAPITDLQLYGQGENSCQVMVSELLSSGGGIEVEHLSPIELGLRQPVQLVFSEGDVLVPAEQSRNYQNKTGCESLHIPDAGHFDFIHPETVAGDAVMRILGAHRDEDR